MTKFLRKTVFWQKVVFALLLATFINVTSSTAQSDYVVNGNASSSGNNYWVLTPWAGGQSGSVWYQNYMSLNYNFDFNFQVFLGNDDGGADGIAFVMQPNSTGAGSAGGGLGYQGITPSLAVEYDTYQNESDPWYDHIALQPNGNVNTTSGALVHEAARADRGNIEDGQWHSTRIVWDATAKNLKVYFDNNVRLNYTGDVVNNIFGGKPNVYWGFTGATGGAANLQQFGVISSFFQVAPLAVTATAAMNCANNTGTITASGNGGYAPHSYSVNNRDFQSSPSFNNMAVGTYTVTVKDVKGTLQSTTVSLNDCNVAPVAKAKPLTISADGNCQGVATANNFDNGSTDANGDAMTFSVSPTGPYAIGATSVTLTVTDTKGASSTTTTTVTVVDNTAPVFASVNAINVNTDPGRDGAVVTFNKPIANDNCTANFNYFNPGEPNNAGNEDHLHFYNGGTWNDFRGSNDLPSFIEFNAITAANFTNYTKMGDFNGHSYYRSNTSQTWSAARAAALGIGADLVSINTQEENQFLASHGGNVWVGGYQDHNDPNYAEPGTAVQSFGGWKWVDGTPLGISVVVKQTAGLASGSLFPIGTTRNTFEARDAAGNVSVTSFDVIVADKTPPVAIAKNLTVELDATGKATITPAQVNNGSSDASGIASMTLDKSTFDCSNITGRSPNSFALNFDGNDYVSIPDAQALRVTGDITVEAWFKVDAFNSDWVRVFGKGDSHNRNYGLWYHPNGIFLFQQYGGGADIYVNQPIAVGQWYHIAGVREGNVSKLFINGNQVNTGSASGAPATSSHPATIGYAPGVHTSHRGQIDEVRLWNVARTNAQIASNYNVGLSGNETGLVAYYNMEEGTGATLGNKANASHNGNLLSFTQPTVWTNSSTALSGGPGTGNTVTLTVTDNHGNVSSTTAKVTVQDKVAPVINCPENINVNATSANGAVVNYLTPVGTDNCSGATTSRIAGLASGSTFPIGATTVTHEVSDASGNKTSCSFTVTVTGLAPQIVCSTNITVNSAAEQCGANVNFAATETVGIPASTITYSIPSGSFFPVGTTVVTATATNAVGTSSCTFNVTVEDKTAPIAKAQNITVELDAAGKATITADQINNGSSDNCGIASLALDKTAFDCSNVGANTVTLTVTDNNGNESTATATVTVEDKVAPIAKAQNITVQLDAAGNATITAGQINNGSSDVCGIKTLSLDKSTFNCSNVGANTVTLTATDNSGNVSAATATVTVMDNSAPIVALNGTATVTHEAYTSYTDAGATATDNCAANLATNNAVNANVPGTYTVTYTATDAAGNTTTVTRTVKVVDTIAPNAIAQNISATLGANGNVVITPSQIDNGSSDASGQMTFALSSTLFSCANIGANTVTLTVTDNSGNASTATATVNVIGAIPTPSITVKPSSNVYTGADASTIFLGYGAQSVTLAASNGSYTATYTWSPATGLSTTQGANPVFTPTEAGNYTFTVTATNQYGCSETATVVIKVVEARCGNKNRNDKVLVCHKGNEICIDANAVAAHLAHGCSIGACNTTKAVSSKSLEVAQPAQRELVAYPNPFTSNTTLAFTLEETGNYRLELYDMKGAMIAVIAEGTGEADSNHSFEISGRKLPAGMYVARLVTANGVKNAKIIRGR